MQRSVETGLAVEFKARFTRQPSRDPDAEDPKPGAYGRNSPFSCVASFFAVYKHSNDELIFCLFHLCSLIFPGVKLASDKQFTGFLEGLGPAQLAGRQTLATPPMGKHIPQHVLFYFLVLDWNINVDVTTQLTPPNTTLSGRLLDIR